MSRKHPAWTRTRIGRDRVHWVAYDDRADSDDRQIVDQGYAASLTEADAAARSALAAAGMFGARRLPSGPRKTVASADRRPAAPGRSGPREYLYSRLDDDLDDGPFVAAHLVVRKTTGKIYASLRSCGPDQIGTEDESWNADERSISVDRARLERDGFAPSGGLRRSSLYASLSVARGDSADRHRRALDSLQIEPPCTVEEIKAAYRRRALEAHPDRGGDAAEFRNVEAAYRRLIREAQGTMG